MPLERNVEGDRSDAKRKGSVSSRRQPILDARVRRQIGERLRAMYNDVLAQGVSTRLADLLKELDEPKQNGHPSDGC